MRYDQVITFVNSGGQPKYDPLSGDYLAPTEVRTNKLANLTAMTAQRQQALYGDVKNTRFTIRLQRIYSHPFDYIEYEGKRYDLDTNKTPQNSSVLIVGRNG